MPRARSVNSHQSCTIARIHPNSGPIVVVNPLNYLFITRKACFPYLDILVVMRSFLLIFLNGMDTRTLNSLHRFIEASLLHSAENNFAAIEDNSYKNTVSIDIRKFTQMNGNPLPYKTSQHKTSNRRQSTQIPFEKKHLSSKPVQERYSIKKPFKNEQHHYSSPQGLSQQYIPEQNLQPPNPKILNLADRINRFAANIGLRLSPDLRPREKISLLEIETIGQEQEGNIVSRMITMENILEQLMIKKWDIFVMFKIWWRRNIL